MEKRKVFQWLTRMEAIERRQFSEYLRSPLHSHRPQLAQMLDHLESTLATSNALANLDFWEMVYPGKPYNANLLNRLLSEIMSELRDFFSLIHFKKDLANQQVSLCKELRARAWEDIIPKEINAADKKLDSEIARDEDYYLAKLQLATERIFYESATLGKNPGKIFQPTINYFETYSTLKMLKLKMYSEVHDRIHKTEHHFILKDHFIQALESKGLPQSEITEVYWLNDQLLSNRDAPDLLQKYVERLKAFTPNYRLKSITNSISREECEDFYTAGINYCSFAINQGKYEYGPFYLELNSFALKNGVFLSKGAIKAPHFINVVGVFIKLREYSWVDSFIEEHGELLEERLKDFAISYLQAATTFFQKDFPKAKKKLLYAKSLLQANTLPGFSLNVRQLLCRVNFETHDWESLHHELNSLHTYITRNKHLYGGLMVRYGNFAKKVRRLERIIHGNPLKVKESLLKLKAQVINEAEIASKEWLMEMIHKQLA